MGQIIILWPIFSSNWSAPVKMVLHYLLFFCKSNDKVLLKDVSEGVSALYFKSQEPDEVLQLVWTVIAWLKSMEQWCMKLKSWPFYEHAIIWIFIVPCTRSLARMDYVDFWFYSWHWTSKSKQGKLWKCQFPTWELCSPAEML